MLEVCVVFVKINQFISCKKSFELVYFWFETNESVLFNDALNAFAYGVVDQLSYLSSQPVLHSWCNKGHGMCYSVCVMVHVKETLLLIEKSSPSSSTWQVVSSHYVVLYHFPCTI